MTHAGAPGPGSPDRESVAVNLAEVRARISRAGGDPARIRIVAVTKGFPASVVRAAVDAGLADVGENYAQELLAKHEEVSPGAEAPLRWHFLGRLQRNKVRALAGKVAVWQSVDRDAIVDELARWAPGASVMVQVNTTGEPQKGGCRPREAAALVDRARAAGLEVVGLMTVGPVEDPEGARKAFERLASLADDLDLRERSMGMTDDLEEAVAAGSTMLRIGRGLFGPRPPR